MSEVVFPARDVWAIHMLKTNPEEYFIRARKNHRHELRVAFWRMGLYSRHGWCYEGKHRA